MTPSFKKPVVWLTLICFVFVYAAPGAAAPALPVPPTDPLVPQTAWDGMAALSDTLRENIDESQYSIKALADRLGRDPVRIFSFVRDKVVFEAYRSSIRGAQGTLEGLAGNALDQSLLLAELLTAIQLPGVKIVAGELPDSKARQLVDQLFTLKNSFNVPAVEVDLGAESRALASILHTSQASIDHLLREQVQVQRDLLGRLNSLARADALFLAGRLYQKNSRLLESASISIPALAGEASQHYWVEFQDSHGNTIQLDPSFNDAGYGAAYTTASEKLSLEQARAKIPTAHLKLIVERLKGSAVERDILWDKKVSLPALADRPVQFSLIPSGLDADKIADGQVSRDEVLQQIKRSEAFQPVVEIAGRREPAHPFDMKGNKREVSGGNLQPAINAITNVLGGLFSSSSSPGPTHFAGLKWEVDIEVLDKHYEAHIYDRLHTETRSSDPRLINDDESAKLELTLNGELMVTTFVRNRERLAADALDQFSQLKQSMDRLSREQNPGDHSQPAVYTLSWQNMVEAAQLEMDYRANAVRAYYAEPRLILYLQQFIPAAENENQLIKRSYDIIANPTRIVANETVAGAVFDARAYGLELGALETALEAWQLGGAEVVNAHNLFKQAVASGQKVAVLAPPESDRVDRFELSPAARANLKKDLAAGFWVIVAEQQIDFNGQNLGSWWRYDPETGNVLGIGENGKGLSEYITTTNIVIGTFIGIGIGFMVCAYVHEEGGRRTQCYRETVHNAFMVMAIMLGALYVLGPLWGSMTVMGLGMGLTGYGLATGNQQAVNLGIGLFFEPAGAIVAGEVVGPLVGAGFRRFSQMIRGAGRAMDDVAAATAGGGFRPALATAVSGDGAVPVLSSSARRMGDFLEMSANWLDDILGESGDLPRHYYRRPSGGSFEDGLNGLLRRPHDDAITEGGWRANVRYTFDGEVPGPGDMLPTMRRVIRGQFNNSNHGADFFAVDDAGRLWVIEAKGSTRHGGALALNGYVERAGGVQMSDNWVSDCASRLANTEDGLANIRQMMNWGDEYTDDAVRQMWQSQAENAHRAVVIPDGYAVDHHSIHAAGMSLDDVYHIRGWEGW